MLSFDKPVYLPKWVKKNMNIRLKTRHVEIYISSCYTNLPNPSARVGYDTRSIFKRSLTGLNSEFSFS